MTVEKERLLETRGSSVPQLPLPELEEATKFYWDFARRHKLAILRCRKCGTFIHLPRPLCRACLSTDLEPFVVSGRGRVYSYTIVHYIFHPAFAQRVPYIVALVELEEDPAVRIICNIVECSRERIRSGMEVEVVFDDITPEISLPQFRPLSTAVHPKTTTFRRKDGMSKSL